MKNIKKKILAFFFSILSGSLMLTGCDFIVNEFVFHPDTNNLLSQEKLPENVREIFIETEDQIRIQGYFIPSRHSKRILIYFHGNGGNISQRIPDLMTLNEFGINVLGVSYRGYGKSEGKPTEAGIYKDGKAALHYATGHLGFKLNNVILFGRSLGTTVAVNTAQHLNVAGLILVTPLTSAEDHARANGFGPFASLAGNFLNNINKIDNIDCPLLVIQGTKDRVIPFNMGKEVYDKATSQKEFVKIEGAGHNNLSTSYKYAYWPPIYNFIQKLNSIAAINTN